MQTVVEPIRKTVELACSAEHAWNVFTGRITSWWPVATHSVAAYKEGVAVTEVQFEGRVGGRLVERMSDGEEAEWGVLRVWDPPKRLVMSWHPGSADQDKDTEVEVMFTALPGNRCRVVLEHRGWEVFGDESIQARAGYENGWPGVWHEFVEFVVA